MAASFKIKGEREMVRAIRRLADKAPKEVAAAMYLTAEVDVMTPSKRDYAPVSPSGGTLRASGHVQDPEFRGRDISVTMAYGGASAPYATAVHEHDSEHSPPSWEGKVLDFHLGGLVGTKYLERPFMKARAGMVGRIARRVNLPEFT